MKKEKETEEVKAPLAVKPPTIEEKFEALSLKFNDLEKKFREHTANHV